MLEPCCPNPNYMLFQYRHKAGGSNSESILVSQLQHGLALEFEHSDPLRRLRLVLSELLAIMTKVSTYFAPAYLPTYLPTVFKVVYNPKTVYICCTGS